MQINFKNVTYKYNEGTPLEKVALKDINLQINEGEIVGIIGQTGSGKSTLLQHFNALLTPTSGDVLIDDINTKDKTKKKIEIRKRVGLVFQYPEYQLFEETIYDDIAYGPKNLGCSDEEIEERIKWTCELVNIDFKTTKLKSPFELSGGQKRRVAIAGVLAMKPKFLVLDEPTSGLDPGGRNAILEEIKNLHEKEDMTIILVSHSMEDVANMVDRIIVLKDGTIQMDDKTKNIFSKAEKLKELGLDIPQVTELMLELKKNGMDIPVDTLNIEDTYQAIKKELIKRRDKKC